MIVLYARMLRYRVAAMIWMFLLLAAARHGGLAHLSPRFAWAALVLASSYVAATAVNDVADRDIDHVNHPRDAGRPLVAGTADEAALRRLHGLACALAFAAAVPLGPPALVVVAVSLGIGRAYSLAPLRISYRTYLAPLVLAVAYVLVPYALGLLVARAQPGGRDAVFAAALYALFVARINLKDFRDRAGDALYGKPTLLLRFGKATTCAVSLVALALGDALLVAALRPPLAALLVLQLFAAAIAVQLRALSRTDDPRLEQVAIGLGARMGNGLLLSALAWLALGAGAAPSSARLGFLVALAAAFGLGYAALATRPQEAVIGYKG